MVLVMKINKIIKIIQTKKDTEKASYYLPKRSRTAEIGDSLKNITINIQHTLNICNYLRIDVDSLLRIEKQDSWSVFSLFFPHRNAFY